MTKKHNTNISGRKGITIINQQIAHNHQTTQKPILKRNYIIALVLAILLGWLGVDRFYVNHIGLGIVKILTFGAFGIWWAIDIIMFATKNISYVEWE